MNEDWREGLTDEELFEKWQGLIAHLMKKYYSNLHSFDMDIDDFHQEGYIALWKAIQSYDPETKIPFGKYAYICIYRALRNWNGCHYRAMDSSQPFIMRSVDHNTLEDDDGKGYMTNDIFNSMTSDENLYLQDFIDGLTPRQKVIYQMSYEGKSRQEIMDMTFVSPQTIATEKQKIREKYEKYAYKW